MSTSKQCEETRNGLIQFASHIRIVRPMYDVGCIVEAVNLIEEMDAQLCNLYPDREPADYIKGQDNE